MWVIPTWSFELQTLEQRLYKHYQALRHLGKTEASQRKCQSFGHSWNDNDLILHLAKHWKMSCSEIKKIVRARQDENKNGT